MLKCLRKMNFLMRFRDVVVDIFWTIKPMKVKFSFMLFFNMLIIYSLICFVNCKQGIAFFFHTATQSKNTRRDSKRYSFVMNYGHFAQEKLQQQLKFEENFLSMLQLFSFWFSFLNWLCLSRRGELPLFRWSHFLDCGLHFWNTSKIFSFLNFSLAPNPTFDVPKQNVVTCCCDAPSPWALRQKVQDVLFMQAKFHGYIHFEQVKLGC